MDYTLIDKYIHKLVKDSDCEFTAWNLEKKRQGKKANWNYIDGCMITALLEIGRITGEKIYFDFAESFISHFVNEDGSILGYKEAESLDDINEGRALFELYERTGKEKYKKAAGYLHGQLEVQPCTPEGNYWHKGIYPNQVWLDGIYMAQPFRALYEKYFGAGDYADIVKQVKNVRSLMFDEEKKLYYHGYDATKSMFWADSKTGCSANFWLRAEGWFSVALIDLAGILPEGSLNDEIRDIFKELMESLSGYADSTTGMYWQVIDCPDKEGNYLETSGSSMIAYAMLKGARLGILGNEYAVLGKKTFDGIIDKYLTEKEGTLELGGICLVAGLGPENNKRRDGSYEYYISEPVVMNDAKGVAPFVLAYTEVMRA